MALRSKTAPLIAKSASGRSKGNDVEPHVRPVEKSPSLRRNGASLRRLRRPQSRFEFERRVDDGGRSANQIPCASRTDSTGFPARRQSSTAGPPSG